MAPIELKDAYISSPMSAGSGFMQTVFQLMGNPFRRVRLERADVKLSVVHRRQSATLDGVWLQTQQVKPGDTLQLTLRLRPYNKESVRQTIEVPLPRTLPDGDYELALMGGRDAGGVMDMQAMMRAMMQGRNPEQGDSQSFEELVQEILKRHPANRIVARLEVPAMGVRYKDKKLENLPNSIFVTLASNPSAGVKMERDRIELTKATDWIIEGRKTVKFEVRTPGQVGAQEQK
jgi:hypothetical protein